MILISPRREKYLLIITNSVNRRGIVACKVAKGTFDVMHYLYQVYKMSAFWKGRFVIFYLYN